ncbi:MAG TPA: prolyl oligopeptidase family serine peptidase [Candidatus Dormibacteraeota bacterium]|nr:prolyl oligopeptidase family serine peptidase [Candidatus Dormibacteraeota bacterium]
MRISKHLLLFTILLSFASLNSAQAKPKLTLDEFFNSVDYPSIAISPDGASVVIAAERADWDQKIFRTDLWLYRDDGKSGSLIQLTQSGHDTEPKWSPDGRWIAFLSERKASSEKDSDSDDKKNDKKNDQKKDKEGKDETAQIYLISPAGGEAIPLTEGEEEVHTFAWSADSRTLYFATRNPWTKAQKDEYKKRWKDVVQYRTAERGDTIFSLDLAAALTYHAAAPTKSESDSAKEPDLTPGAVAMATTALRVDTLLISPDGRRLAFLTNAINQRQEKSEDVEIYIIGQSRFSGGASATLGSAEQAIDPKIPLPEPHRITHNEAIETHLHWANDSRHIFFTVEVGDVSGPYRDLQPHLYWVDTDSGAVERWSKDFIGPVDHYAVAADSVLASARSGTEVAMYSVARPNQSLHKLNGWEGTYATLSTAAHSPRIAFIYSSLQKPAEVYLAESADKLDQARPISSFNKLFTERDLPQGKPYRWKTDDGTTVEGMLIYPPGKFEAKHLPMFTFIHGGPADADGNHFEADWYQWAQLAATNGWLVFEPNYRGSSGYGDKFLEQIVPQIVTRPGKDILEGVDALVKDGTADADHLTIGGYSYGGYMTNWLITQTTRFKAAVTGAGAVEHIANWGNDDDTQDDAYFLGGRPWEAPQRYHDEAAIFQIDKVRTPTHIVAGADDIRVAVLEDYLLEHALYSLGIPNKLLIFPGEGHSLAKNPWHGKIKVREELKWLQKYGGVPSNNEPNPPVPTPK